MFRLTLTLPLAVSILLAASVVGDAQAKNDKDKGKPAHAGKVTGSSGSGSATDVAVGAAVGAAAAILTDSLLSDQDRRIIESYYRTNTISAQALPPGIAKNLARGKPLPPGIAKKQVPEDLRTRIKIPSGYELSQVGTDVLLIEVGSRVVTEILKDIVRN